jgi:hypothetical protein
MIDDPEMLPLEESCLQPGHWLIEGHDVKRVRMSGQRTRWNIYFVVAEPIAVTSTLAEARTFIRNERGT